MESSALDFDITTELAIKMTNKTKESPHNLNAATGTPIYHYSKITIWFMYTMCRLNSSPDTDLSFASKKCLIHNPPDEKC